MDLTIMRIYMTTSAKWIGELTWWQRVFNSSLAYQLIKNAKTAGIEQAVFQKAFAGYLKGKKLAFDHSEVSPPDLPVCVELVDTPEALKTFFQEQKAYLKDCRVVIFNSVHLIA